MNRFLTPHSTYTVNAIHPEDITNYRGFPKTWYVDAFLEREGYYPETSFQDPGVTAKNLPGFGVQHRRFLRRYNQMTSILLLADDPPRADNHIATDRSGDPGIDYTVLDPVRPALAKGLRRGARPRQSSRRTGACMGSIPSLSPTPPSS